MNVSYLIRVIRLIFIGGGGTVLLISCTKNSNVSTHILTQTAIFAKHTEQSIELYLLPLPGDSPQFITQIDNNERYKLSPNGSYLAVYLADSLRVVDLLAFNEFTLATDVSWPTMFIENIEHDFLFWSPHGDKLIALTGGPSWEDESLTSTTLTIFDMQHQFPEFTLNTGTWINDAAWSSNSSMIAFAELEVSPCWFIENCKGEDSPPNGRLTTLTHTETNTWGLLASTNHPHINDSWRLNSICQLTLLSVDAISYQSPCALGQLAARSFFITAIGSSSPSLEVSEELYSEESKYFSVYPLGIENQFIVASRNESFGISRESSSFLDMYKRDETTITLLNQEILQDSLFTVPVTLDFSPDSKYAIGELEGRTSILVQTHNSATTSTLIALPLSLKGLWLSEGYLTQSEKSIILVDPRTGKWEVVQDNLPKDFILVGWQTPEK